ncbi:hypothetical protein ECE50_005630 [Chitinophaga sp. Mgbs1]|uniref:Uncharacterized protein n=1 Tax=Chitinophaga solisilvae TaxID=1233460 RepID=A0A3S1B0Q3_9BACT|nr:hypothetical protein [Chitinophaga solisilvae]
MKPLLLNLLFLCGCAIGWLPAVHAQSVWTDSLQAVVNLPATSPEKKTALLNQLSESYRAAKIFDRAEATARQSAVIALQHKNFAEAAKAYMQLTNVKVNTQQLQSLKRTCDSTLLLAQQAKDPVAMAYACYAQVLLYKILDNETDMVRYGQLGLKQLEKENDPYIAAKIYYQLYVVNSAWNNEEKVNIYALKATENALQTTDYNLLSNCYTALSIAHEYKYDSTKNKTELDSIFFFLNKSEELYRQYPGQVAPSTYAIACINIASTYQRYFPENHPEARTLAIRYADTARSVLKNSPYNREVLASSLGILSEYALRENKQFLAEHYLLEAYEAMLADKTPYNHTMINVVTALSSLYERMGLYQKALQFQQKATLYNNKNFKAQQALNAQKLEIQYETEKKNNEMRILKERENSRRIQNYLYGCIALAAFLGLIFMFRSYHFRLRYSLQREKQLQLEKQDSELQIKLEKEEQARLRAEQQLMEVQQQQLKKEVMANVIQLEHKNQVLHQIKDKLTEGEPVNLQKMLKEEMVLDSDFEHARLQIQQVHPDFFQLLQDKALKKLTLLDLKLCAYLYLKMDTRQISRLMHIEPKSVRMSRYRIKQKLGLDKEEDLYIFLQGLTA